MTQPRTASRAATARERARAELTREIKEEARRQLTAVGADGLSLRAVAKELGMVSSALYRYYPSRDDLLTALIIDAYNALGAAAEQAIAAAASPREGWTAACHAIRGGRCPGELDRDQCAAATDECANRHRWRSGVQDPSADAFHHRQRSDLRRRRRRHHGV